MNMEIRVSLCSSLLRILRLFCLLCLIFSRLNNPISCDLSSQIMFSNLLIILIALPWTLPVGSHLFWRSGIKNWKQYSCWGLSGAEKFSQAPLFPRTRIFHSTWRSCLVFFSWSTKAPDFYFFFCRTDTYSVITVFRVLCIRNNFI